MEAPIQLSVRRRKAVAPARYRAAMSPEQDLRASPPPSLMDTQGPWDTPMPQLPPEAVSEQLQEFFYRSDRGRCLCFVLPRRQPGDPKGWEGTLQRVVVGVLEMERSSKKPYIWVLLAGDQGCGELRRLMTLDFGPWAEAAGGRNHGTMDWKKTLCTSFMLGGSRNRNGSLHKSASSWKGARLGDGVY